MLGLAIESLRRQTHPPDAIYLWLPREHFREHPDGYDFPGIEVRFSRDYGPATKLLPLLAVESDPDTLIITIDDDVEYPADLVDKLVRSSQLFPDQAIGFTGWILSGQDEQPSVCHMNEDVGESAMFQPVHVLEGYRGVSYRRALFETDIIGHFDALADFRHHDDILFSGYLASRRIGRLSRWFDGHPGASSGSAAWKLLGQQIGLHTRPNWLAEGRACVEYWRRLVTDVFPVVPGIPPARRLQLGGDRFPRQGFTHRSLARADMDGRAGVSADASDWPWPDGSFDEVLLVMDACDPADGDLLARAGHWLRESWRIARVDGIVAVHLPASFLPAANGFLRAGNACSALIETAGLFPGVVHPYIVERGSAGIVVIARK